MSNKNNEEIKFMGSTKSEIWKAYKTAKAELDAKQDEPVSTVAKAKADKVTASIASANNINIDSVEDVLTTLVDHVGTLKNQYDDILSAIAAKKEELKEVHNIEVSANDLAALAAVKSKLVEEASEKAAILKAEADEYYNQKEKDAKEFIEKTLRERKREEEVYQYETARTRAKKEDELADFLYNKKRSLDDREKEVIMKEEEAKATQQRIEDLESKIKDLENNMNTAIESARIEATEKAKKSAQYVANMDKASTNADAKIQESTINSLKERVVNLEEQLSKATELVAKANVQVAEMAKSALTAQADAATVAKVSEIAAGSNNKR